MNLENQIQPWLELARFFGRTLLAELDRSRLEELHVPEVKQALETLGVEVPPLTDESLECLGAQYFEVFLQPRSSSPPVQSLWVEGKYEGEAAISIRRLAKVANLKYQKELARGAPVDHLGCILILWAESFCRAPAVARILEQQHLAWATPFLIQTAQLHSGFYGQVARALANFLEELQAFLSQPELEEHFSNP